MLGTPAENTKDMLERKGPSRSRLTKDEVREIRSWLKHGDTAKNLAMDYRVTQQTIERIQNRKTWVHLK
jgi:hypothetical protein